MEMEKARRFSGISLGLPTGSYLVWSGRRVKANEIREISGFDFPDIPKSSIRN